VLCKNREHCRFYLRELLVKDFNYKMYRDLEIRSEDERVIFMTPDDTEKMRGLRINSFIVTGPAFENPKYYEAKNILKERIIEEKYEHF